ncbi:MAG: hypothetical protein ACWGON_03425 [Gemmatimonadota bacterium]
MGNATREFQQRRGLIVDMSNEGDSTTIESISRRACAESASNSSLFSSNDSR